VAKHLQDKSFHLNLESMLKWSVPLAAEEITNEVIWKKFKDITLENVDKLGFKDYVNLAWSFSKVNY
jgi:hypothetical protein